MEEVMGQTVKMEVQREFMIVSEPRHRARAELQVFTVSTRALCSGGGHLPSWHHLTA